MNTGKIPQQVVVLSAIAVVVVVSFFGMRALFVPESFGKYGHYRANAVDTVAKLPISYAGAKVCAECHDEEDKVKSQGFHRSVSCEVCHGPGAAHVEDPGTVKPTAPRQRGLCPLCHNYSPSRPTGFPQIVTAQHNPGKPCMTCHKPHDPVPPNTPKDCNACHRSISSQKQVSPHASLECAVCHQVPREHSSNPRAFTVGKPKENKACEQCHANKSAQPASTIPQVAPEHTGRYLCWDCHYPHFPGGEEMSLDKKQGGCPGTTAAAASGGCPETATSEMDRRQFFDLCKQALPAGLTLLAAGLPISLASADTTTPAPGAAVPEPKLANYAMAIDIEKCIGCGRCAAACKAENKVPDSPHYVRTWVERYVVPKEGETMVDSPNAGIDGFPDLPPVDTLKTFFAPKLCNHCANPPCVQVCPVGATFQTRDGVVLVDEDYCVGCRYCIQACPYGARYLHPEKLVADKCTFCYHRITKGLLPACVEVCPTQARVFGDLNSRSSPIQRVLRFNPITSLKAELNTRPKVFYANADQEIR